MAGWRVCEPTQELLKAATAEIVSPLRTQFGDDKGKRKRGGWTPTHRNGFLCVRLVSEREKKAAVDNWGIPREAREVHFPLSFFLSLRSGLRS
jgi:hypothetical protein